MDVAIKWFAMDRKSYQKAEYGPTVEDIDATQLATIRHAEAYLRKLTICHEIAANMDFDKRRKEHADHE